MNTKAAAAKASLTDGSVFSGMTHFFIPIMLGTLLQQLYSTVDAVILGNFVGKGALAAVGGSALVIINLLVGFFVGLASGASVVISQYFGAKEEDSLRRSVHTAMLLSIGIGAVVTVVGILLTPALLRALDTPEDILTYSTQYLQWYFAGMIPSMIYNMGSGVLRAVGDSKRPLLFLAVCTVVNTFLDLLFVGVFRLEVAGAAVATSLSQLICAGLVWVTLARQKGAWRLERRHLQADWTIMGRMLLLGLPAGIQSTLYGVTNLYVQKATNLLGTDTVAAWSAFWKLDGIYWPISGAIGIAVTTFVGQNYGARNQDRIRQSIRAGMIIHVVFSAAFSCLLFLTRNFTIGLFCDDPMVVAQGVQLVNWIAFAYPLVFPSEVLSAAMRGVGNAVKPMVLTFFGICVLRLVILFTVTFPHLSSLTIAICYPITWTASSVLFLLYFKFGKWMPKLA